MREAVLKASEKGLSVSISIILGLPEDTPERAQKTLDFVKSLPLERYVHNHLNIYEGTELFQDHNKYGIELEKKSFSPFYFTKHSYNVMDIKVLPGASNMNFYIKDKLLTAILSLTGLVNTYMNFHIPSIGITGKINPKINEEYLKSGSVVFIMNNNENIPDLLHQSHLSISLTSCGDYYKADGYYVSHLPVPLIKLLEGKEINTDGHISYMDFVSSSFLLDNSIESKEKLWKLPYSACSLMPCICPAVEKKVFNLDNPSLCPFYPVELGLKYDECSNCKVESCPKCPYMLNNFKDKYCSFHRSDRSKDLFIYILSHLYYLITQNPDLKKLPEIFIERRNAFYIVLIDKHMFTVKRDISEKSYLSYLKWKSIDNQLSHAEF